MKPELTTLPLDPLRVLQMLIKEIGVMSQGWAVDILVAAMEYLSSKDVAEYLDRKTVQVQGVNIIQSTVDMWARGEVRHIDAEPKGRIIWRQ